ncbi:MAG TPA: SDR family oxidoreductase [Chthoniobacteraceae bacterium]|nr:SDR family oxidoreductase [Chthoniobacteraceae bacterium]
MIAIDLTGKNALVTGASQGLGAAIAARLHEAGASVALNYFPDDAGENQRRAEQLVERLGPRSAAFPADVRDSQAVAQLCQAVVDRFGPLDLLVNNAGIVRDRTVAKMSDDEWSAVIDTNLSGVFRVCRAGAALLRDGGRIVNLASVSASVGLFGQGNYAAAKAGVLGLTRTLSRELARQNITVNAVAPGLVLTEMGQTVPEAIRDRWCSEIPLGRFAEPQEIADAVLFLCSDLASYVTGQTLHLNGGWYA